MLATILKKYVWVVNLCLLTGLAYLAATTVNQKIESMISSPRAAASQKFFQNGRDNKPVSTTKRSLSYYHVILTRNIFGIKNLSDSSLSPTNQEDLPDTTLNIVLLGTIINKDGSSVAIIKNPDNNRVDGYHSGEVIDIISSDNVKLVEVTNCKVVIDRQKTGRETIKCKDLGDVASTAPAAPSGRRTLTRRGGEARGEDEGIRKVGESEYEVSRELLEEVLSDPTTIVQQARVIPQEDGLRFFGIRSNSIFWKIGIKNGDTLRRINNVDLNNVEKALSVFEELRSQSNFTIDFTRAGKDYTYEYNVK